MKTVLLTGFEPFGGETVNPSYDIIESLDSTMFDANIVKLRVPTVFGQSEKTILKAIQDTQPEIVIMLGLAQDRKEISLERVAINVDDARIPDNKGFMPKNRPIVSSGPAAYFSTLPIHGMEKSLTKKGIPVKISNSAGTFVCNHVMYHVLHEGFMKYPNLKAGFIHLPQFPEQARLKSLPYSMERGQMENALGCIIETALR